MEYTYTKYTEPHHKIIPIRAWLQNIAMTEYFRDAMSMKAQALIFLEDKYLYEHEMTYCGTIKHSVLPRKWKLERSNTASHRTSLFHSLYSQ